MPVCSVSLTAGHAHIPTGVLPVSVPQRRENEDLYYNMD
jgi:hypothetical protein